MGMQSMGNRGTTWNDIACKYQKRLRKKSTVPITNIRTLSIDLDGMVIS